MFCHESISINYSDSHITAAKLVFSICLLHFIRKTITLKRSNSHSLYFFFKTSFYPIISIQPHPRIKMFQTLSMKVLNNYMKWKIRTWTLWKNLQLLYKNVRFLIIKTLTLVCQELCEQLFDALLCYHCLDSRSELSRCCWYRRRKH